VRHPVLALIALLSAVYALIRYPELVIGVVVAVAIFVLIGHWFVRALPLFGRHRGARR
jgi:hypothetical protein